MRLKRSGTWPRYASLAAIALALSAPLLAQDSQTEVRIRAMEAQLRALQRKVFPGDGKFFVTEPAPTTTGQTATSPVTDLQSRLDSVEAQIKRLTALSEENSNKLAQLETRLAGTPSTAATTQPASAPAATPAVTTATSTTTPPVAAAPTPAASPTPAPSPTPSVSAANSNLSAMTGGASAPKPKPAATAPSRPSAQRLAAVSAITKPQTDDPGDDEYSYGFRLWEAKFFPEAQQQLKMMIDKYPRHARISFARNLMGRAFLDDGKPREAATWFLQNYQAAKTGERAADSLLLLAESMRQLNDTKRACIALTEFGANFPREAAGRLKSQYDTTRGGVKCN